MILNFHCPLGGQVYISTEENRILVKMQSGLKEKVSRKKYTFIPAF